MVSIPLTDINDGDFQTKLCLLASVSTAVLNAYWCGYSAWLLRMVTPHCLLYILRTRQDVAWSDE